MTSYHIVAPVFIGRFQEPDGVVFHTWSPQRYGPAYTYDIIIEGEDDQHPSMNMEYIDALQRVMYRTDTLNGFVDISTDYHCPTPLDERSDVLYLVTLRDSPFSPVFFLKEDAELYLTHLYDSFIGQRPFLQIREATHSFI